MFTSVHLLALGISIITIGALLLYLRTSKSGKALRAVACNRQMAEVVGIDRRSTFMMAMILASLVGSLAIVPFAMNTMVEPYMGMTPLFICFVTTFLGGIGNIRGAILAGLILGVLENLSLLWLAQDWQIVVSFAVLFIIIIFRPRGLLQSYR
jgi:branched-chain amino acid transport system permease protein